MYNISCDFNKKLRKYHQKIVIQKFASTNRYGTLNFTLTIKKYYLTCRHNAISYVIIEMRKY